MTDRRTGTAPDPPTDLPDHDRRGRPTPDAPDTGAGSLAAVAAPAARRPRPGQCCIGAADGTVAVPEAAQAVVAAALAAFTRAHARCWWSPPTGLDAERLGDDLACLLAPEGTRREPDAGPVVGALAGPVAVLPAWETLPFERVSPETETMGRRLAVLHALTARARRRRCRRRPGSSSPRSGPSCSGSGPLDGHGARRSIRPGQQVDVGRAAAPAGGDGVPARAPGGAPWGVRRARRHRRRLPLHGGRRRSASTSGATRSTG